MSILPGLPSGQASSDVTPTRGSPEILDEPALAHYVTGWPRPGDLGVVAENQRGEPIGAAWLRLLDGDDPGYGFVTADVPELSIAVAQEQRGHGVGRALVERLAAVAGEQGHTRMSLSVEPDNPAHHLYRSLGFREVGVTGGAVTMVLDLAP